MADRVPSLRRKSSHRLPHLMKKLSATMPADKRKSRFLCWSNGSWLGIVITQGIGPMPSYSFSTQNKNKDTIRHFLSYFTWVFKNISLVLCLYILVSDFVIYEIFCMSFLFISFYFFFVFLKGRQLWRWRASQRSWGRGKVLSCE